MYCAMVMSHLILARTRTEDDAAINKTIARRLDQWVKWDIDSLLVEAKVIQERMSELKQNNLLLNKKDFDKKHVNRKNFQCRSKS